jgi:hypothetical protein
VEYFKYLGSTVTNDEDVHATSDQGLTLAKAAFNTKKALFTSKLDFNLRKKLLRCYIWSKLFMVLKLEQIGKIRNAWKVMKCGAGEGWKRSFGLIA